ncbi:hypothetical protein ACH3XW_5320 [Acanthocheilonema viteae]|uniref:RING-type domain-containing protein n=1 Tax=Acanthocheilonema viteae TaxID=6277 RepID=A0A498S528_ACAVI|nr:unnamed protein product [Acanthocheilonema viteae]
MSENRKCTPCASGCHSATDAHVFVSITDAKPSDSDYELPPMPTMQECDGICGDIYSSDQLTKFPCLHVLCGMCLNECSLIERDGKFLCPMRECKYLSTTALRMHESAATLNDDRESNPVETPSDANFSSVTPITKLDASKLSESESESDKDRMKND